MAFDILNETEPQNTQKRPSYPTIPDLEAALTDYNSTSYSQDRLNGMTKNDLIHAARLHGLEVNGLSPLS